MAEKSKDRLSFLLDSYLQGREDSTELLYGGRCAAARRQSELSQQSESSLQPESMEDSCSLAVAESACEGVGEQCLVGESGDRLLSILDDFLEEAGMSSDVLELGMPAQDYVRNYLENMPDAPVTGLEKDIRDKTGSLLDAFLSSGSEKLDLSGTDADDESGSSGNADLGAGGRRFEESFFTETLAEIFMKQHRYDKALEIIRSLYLNFPNKSIYFADQIRYLEKLIRIN